MTIKRKINGQEIEIALTYEEELEIFNNWKLQGAMEMCEWFDEYEQMYGVTEEEYNELLPDIAREFLKNQEVDADMQYDRDNAVETILTSVSGGNNKALYEEE